jgi:hypothetical protein
VHYFLYFIYQLVCNFDFRRQDNRVYSLKQWEIWVFWCDQIYCTICEFFGVQELLLPRVKFDKFWINYYIKIFILFKHAHKSFILIRSQNPIYNTLWNIPQIHTKIIVLWQFAGLADITVVEIVPSDSRQFRCCCTINCGSRCLLLFMKWKKNWLL